MAYTNQQRHTEEKIRAMTKYQASSTVGAASIFAFRGAAQQHVFAAGVCLIVLSGVFMSRIIKADRKLKIMTLPDPDSEALWAEINCEKTYCFLFAISSNSKRGFPTASVRHGPRSGVPPH